MKKSLFICVPFAVLPWAALALGPDSPSKTDAELRQRLKAAGFTGKIQSTLEKRLGRPVNGRLADLGRFVFFDKFMGLHEDNSCAGCHSPRAGFGDSQSIAIGVDSNGIVGPGRKGARNQRRTPTVVNTAFYPKLMHNGRFFAPSGDPFDNREGFAFPDPEGTTLFRPRDPQIRHLLVAQAHIPFTELPEMAGFTGISKGDFKTLNFPTRTFSAGKDGEPDFGQFDDGHGVSLPAKDGDYYNAPIRALVLDRLNAKPAWRREFGRVFPEVARGRPITFPMIGHALAEFQISLTRADAPIDRYARGDLKALTPSMKNGANVFFGKGKCVTCHAVGGKSNEMFSDFENHAIGVPQLAPVFGKDEGNVVFRGDALNEDFGLEDITGKLSDRYKFRTSPLRNVALQPTFFHNGAFTRLEDAIRHHLDVKRSLLGYDPTRANIAPDLRTNLGPSLPLLEQLDPALETPIQLTTLEFNDLVSFVRYGLLDPNASDTNFQRLIPKTVPSGLPLQTFQKSPGG